MRGSLDRGRYCRHLAEMIAAMFGGMVFFQIGLAAIWPAFGSYIANVSVVTEAFLMCIYMSAGMAIVMGFRRYSGVQAIEMSAAMFVPTIALLVPYKTGIIGGEMLLLATHLLMLPIMAIMVLFRHGTAGAVDNRAELDRSAGTSN